MLTEFGFPAFYESSMSLSQAQDDLTQSFFYLSFLNEMLKAINEDGVKVAGAIGWAFVDNWEWGEYDDRFGVQAFNSTTLERSYKRSIFDFVDFVVTHGGS
jgi:beta-glucosidase/6-phospho-beta-glucosidase/beta-galactosidase